MNKKTKIDLKIVRIIEFLCAMFNHTGEYGYDYYKITDSVVL